MIKIPRLVGVNHGGPSKFSTFYPISIRTLPSRELLQDLKSYPKGIVIGVEYAPEFKDTITIGGRKVSAAADCYWRDVVGHLEKNGFGICFLDRLEPYKRVLELELEATALREKLTEAQGNARLEEELKMQIEALQIRQEYILFIERESMFAENIRKVSPYAVLVGDFHASYFFARPEEVGRLHNIVFESYDRDDNPEDWEDAEWATVDGTEEIIFMKLTRNAKPREEMLSYRSDLETRYAALGV